MSTDQPDVDQSKDPQAILEARARLLARVSVAPVVEGTEEFLLFRLSRENYAVESKYVFAVFRLVDITPLPGAEAPLYGVTGWRGDVLTILDLRTVLGSPANALDDLVRVVVLGDRRVAFGILADDVSSTTSIGPSDIFPIPDDHARPREYLKGITRDATLLLDAPALIRRQTDTF